MTQTITYFCYRWLRIIGSVVTLAVFATIRGVRVTSTTLPGGTFEYAGDMAVTRMGITHIDTSDYYGPYVTNQIIKEALYPYPDGLRIVTKVGAERDAEGGWPPARSP